MHLNGAGRSSLPTTGEGVDEASYHRTPACSPELIQSVPDQTEEGGETFNTQTSCEKDVFLCRLCAGGQPLTYINNAGSFSKRKDFEAVLITWRWQAL